MEVNEYAGRKVGEVVKIYGRNYRIHKIVKRVRPRYTIYDAYLEALESNRNRISSIRRDGTFSSFQKSSVWGGRALVEGYNSWAV